MSKKLISYLTIFALNFILIGCNSSSSGGSSTKNDIPVIPIGQIFDVYENADIGDIVGTVLAYTIEGTQESLSYSFVDSGLQSAFSIDPDNGKITVKYDILDYAVKKSYVLTVKVSFNNSSSNKDITINVLNVNEKPVFSQNELIFTIDENVADNAQVNTEDIVATDNDGQTITYSLDSESLHKELFYVTRGDTGAIIKVRNGNNIDYESGISQYELILRASDTEGEYSTQVIKININDIDDIAPIINDITFSQTEGEACTSVMALTTNDDPNIAGYTIVAGNDNDIFSIEDRTITCKKAIDFEENPSYELTIRVMDINNNFSEKKITINIIDLDDTAPNLIKDNYLFYVQKDSEINREVGTLEAIDPDTTSNLEWSLQDSALFSIVPVGDKKAAVKIKNSLSDAISAHELKVKVSDGTNEALYTIRVAVTEGNAPNVPENQSTTHTEGSITNFPVNLGRISATDADGDTLEYSIYSGNSDGEFSIDSGTGDIRLLKYLDYESGKDRILGVTVTDGEYPVQIEYTIVIIDVDDTPPVFEQKTVNINRYLKAGAYVDEIVATDVDTDDALLKYFFKNGLVNSQIAGGVNNDLLSIDEDTGIITLNNATVLEEMFVANTKILRVEIGATDGNRDTTQFLEIGLIQDGQLPTILPNQVFSIDEDIQKNQVVATIAYINTGGLLNNWRFVSGNENNVFSLENVIGSTSVNLTINDNSSIDYEKTSSYTLGLVADNDLYSFPIGTVIVNVNPIKGLIAVRVKHLDNRLADTQFIGLEDKLKLEWDEYNNASQYKIEYWAPGSEEPQSITQSNTEITIADIVRHKGGSLPIQDVLISALSSSGRILASSKKVNFVLYRPNQGIKTFMGINPNAYVPLTPYINRKTYSSFDSQITPDYYSGDYGEDAFYLNEKQILQQGASIVYSYLSSELLSGTLGEGRVRYVDENFEEVVDYNLDFQDLEDSGRAYSNCAKQGPSDYECKAHMIDGYLDRAGNIRLLTTFAYSPRTVYFSDLEKNVDDDSIFDFPQASKVIAGRTGSTRYSFDAKSGLYSSSHVLGTRITAAHVDFIRNFPAWIREIDPGGEEIYQYDKETDMENNSWIYPDARFTANFSFGGRQLLIFSEKTVETPLREDHPNEKVIFTNLGSGGDRFSNNFIGRELANADDDENYPRSVRIASVCHQEATRTSPGIVSHRKKWKTFSKANLACRYTDESKITREFSDSLTSDRVGDKLVSLFISTEEKKAGICIYDLPDVIDQSFTFPRRMLIKERDSTPDGEEYLTGRWVKSPSSASPSSLDLDIFRAKYYNCTATQDDYTSLVASDSHLYPITGETNYQDAKYSTNIEVPHYPNALAVDAIGERIFIGDRRGNINVYKAENCFDTDNSGCNIEFYNTLDASDLGFISRLEWHQLSNSLIVASNKGMRRYNFDRDLLLSHSWISFEQDRPYNPWENPKIGIVNGGGWPKRNLSDLRIRFALKALSPPPNGDNITVSFSANTDYVTLSENQITLNKDAPYGAIVITPKLEDNVLSNDFSGSIHGKKFVADRQTYLTIETSSTSADYEPKTYKILMSPY